MWQVIKHVGRWFEHRLKLKDSVVPVLEHPIPRGAAGPEGWFYCFGSATMTFFLLQIATGICLAIYYVPSSADAYQSLEYINQNVSFGWYMRSLHYWSANGMVVMMFIHMTQVFLFAAYKYPRELTWCFGVILLVLTLGMAFTGQVLRWDSDSYWGVNVGAAMAGRVPWIGPAIVELVIGGQIAAGNTLSRFFALHVFWVPVALMGALFVHLYLVLTVGISKPPVPGEKVDPATYDAKYKAELKKGVPSWATPRTRTFCFRPSW
jgi:ubiquinol-cytochrome c reductase cytochrome b subunit